MSIGRFSAMVGALLWSPPNNTYLLLKRSKEKEFASGVWECVTGRVGQGEGFEDAPHREVYEETGVEVHIEFLIGTTHFSRGEVRPYNELVGVIYCCSIADPSAVHISAEHSEYRWVTPHEASALLVDLDPGTQSTKRIVERAETLKTLIPSELRRFHHEHGCEFSFGSHPEPG
jgi:8-oxo-dGTP pyrophosphatase MutT (NUDIX family)